MKMHWGSGGITPQFLTSALDEGEWLVSRPGRFTPGETAPGTHWIGGWVGPRAGLDRVEQRTNLFLPVTIATELFRISASNTDV
jgi:hypothetical protein